MTKKTWFYIAFFTLILTGFYWFVKDDLKMGKSDSKLAVIVAAVPDFNFTDQNGKSFSQYNTKGKVYLTNYFFTTCKGICPRMNGNMRRVYEAFKNEPEFLILSHTCDPETDSVPVIKKYEHRMLAGPLTQRNDGTWLVGEVDSTAPFTNTNWIFVTGDKAKLYDMARHGYMIDNGKPDTSQIKEQFLHSQFVALVDRQKRMRGIYDALKNNEVDEMINDAKEILNDQVDRKGFMNGFSTAPN